LLHLSFPVKKIIPSQKIPSISEKYLLLEISKNQFTLKKESKKLKRWDLKILLSQKLVI